MWGIARLCATGAVVAGKSQVGPTEQRFRVWLRKVPASGSQVLRLEHSCCREWGKKGRILQFHTDQLPPGACNCQKVPNLTDPQRKDNKSHIHIVLLNFIVQMYNFQVIYLKYRGFGVKIMLFSHPHSLLSFLNWYFILLWLIFGCMALWHFLSGLRGVEHFSWDYSVRGNIFCWPSCHVWYGSYPMSFSLAFVL